MLNEHTTISMIQQGLPTFTTKNIMHDLIRITFQWQQQNKNATTYPIAFYHGHLTWLHSNTDYQDFFILKLSAKGLLTFVLPRRYFVQTPKVLIQIFSNIQVLISQLNWSSKSVQNSNDKRGILIFKILVKMTFSELILLVSPLAVSSSVFITLSCPFLDPPPTFSILSTLDAVINTSAGSYMVYSPASLSMWTWWFTSSTIRVSSECLFTSH